MEHRIAERVRGKLNEELNVRKNRATKSLDEIADLVHRVGEPLHEKPLTPIGHYVEGAAEKLHEIAGELRERTVQDLAQEVREFARNRPAVFAGASIAAGIVAARFLRSSAADSTTRRRAGSQVRQSRPGARKR